MTRIFFSFILGFLLLASCRTGYMVEGNSTISELDGKKLYLKAFCDSDLVNVDSCDVLHGKFSFSGELDSMVMVNLFMGNECLMPFVLGPEEDLVIHLESARQYVTGSALNDTLYNFIQAKTRLDNELAELPHKETQMIMDGVDEDIITLRLNDEANRLAVMHDRLVTDFIVDNSDNVLGPGVFMIMTSSYPYPVMTPQIEEIMSKVSATFKANDYVRKYMEMAKENMKQMGYGSDIPVGDSSQSE